MRERTQADGKDVCSLQKDHARRAERDRHTNSQNFGILIALDKSTYSIISLLSPYETAIQSRGKHRR